MCLAGRKRCGYFCCFLVIYLFDCLFSILMDNTQLLHDREVLNLFISLFFPIPDGKLCC